MSHLVYVHGHINYLLFSTCFLLNIILAIYVRIRNLTVTLKFRIDIDRIDSNSNFALCFHIFNIYCKFSLDAQIWFSTKILRSYSKL